jgi:hypothetical protein
VVYATLTLAVRRPSLHLLKTALSYVAIFCVGAVTSVSCFEPSSAIRRSAAAQPKTTTRMPGRSEVLLGRSFDHRGQEAELLHADGAQRREYGTPIFSGNNNPLSTSGMCVETGGFTSPFPNGCPVPCDPTWDAVDAAEICGTTSKCCQMQELDATKDCVLDPATTSGARSPAPTFLQARPRGARCTRPTRTRSAPTACCSRRAAAAPVAMEAFDDCLDQLTVADQRGFCYDPNKCPCIEDVCAMKNPGYALKCAAAPGTTMPVTTM